jgi:hypothetical protein
MGKMAIGTGRNRARFFFPEFRLYNLRMDLFDFRMAFHAGSRNVININSGIRTGVRQYQVVTVTIVTGGSNDQSSLEQAFAMNALRVIFKDIMLCDIISPGNRSSFPMALPAQHRDIHFVGQRFGIGRR